MIIVTVLCSHGGPVSCRWPPRPDSESGPGARTRRPPRPLLQVPAGPAAGRRVGARGRRARPLRARAGASSAEVPGYG
jgi:hypothetical protein